MPNYYNSYNSTKRISKKPEIKIKRIKFERITVLSLFVISSIFTYICVTNITTEALKLQNLQKSMSIKILQRGSNLWFLFFFFSDCWLAHYVVYNWHNLKRKFRRKSRCTIVIIILITRWNCHYSSFHRSMRTYLNINVSRYMCNEWNCKNYGIYENWWQIKMSQRT